MPPRGGSFNSNMGAKRAANPLKTLMRLFRYFKHCTGLLTVAIISILVYSVASILAVVKTKDLIAVLEAGLGADMAKYVSLLIAMAILYGIATVTNYLLNRLSGFFFDIMIVAGIAAINIEDLRGLWLPFVLLTVAGAVLTWLYLSVVCRRLYAPYYNEGLISMYGMLTGTISSGVLLLREIDPELKTPAANNLITGSSFGILFGAPVLVLITMAAKSDLMCYVTLGLATLYLLILLLIIYKVGKKKPS